MRLIVSYFNMKESFSSCYSGSLGTLNQLSRLFTSYHLCGWCLKMHLTLAPDNILFTIMPSIPRAALTLCFMSSVNAATPVDQPIHCSHLSIKCSPALSERASIGCLFRHCSAISCAYFHFQAGLWILMETYIISWRPVETQRGHVEFFSLSQWCRFSVLG